MPSSTAQPRYVTAYWKARVTRANGKHYWAHTRTICTTDINFEISEYLKEKEVLRVQVYAFHKGARRLLALKGHVSYSVLLSSGTSFGVDMVYDHIDSQSLNFIKEYMQDRQKSQRGAWSLV